MQDLDLNDASRQIDELIEKRAFERAQANFEAAAWQESERKFLTRYQKEHRELWAEHHRRQIVVFEQLADEHRERLLRLIDRRT